MLPHPSEPQNLDQSETPPREETSPKNKSSFWKEVFHFALIIIFVVIPFRIFIAQPFIVSGSSMEPGFQDRDYLIVDQLTYRFNDPERGDVAIFRYPNNTKIFYIKRIIGLPGDTIIVKNEEVYIKQNGSSEQIKVEEPYIDSFRPGDSETTLLIDQYYVMGDNRLVSSDSRVWGPLDREFITGRAFLRLFPFNQINVLPEDYKSYSPSL